MILIVVVVSDVVLLPQLLSVLADVDAIDNRPVLIWPTAEVVSLCKSTWLLATNTRI